MYLTKDLSANPNEIEELEDLLAKIPDTDLIIESTWPRQNSPIIWAHRCSKAVQFHRGQIAKYAAPSALALADMSKIFVADDRTPFEHFRAQFKPEVWSKLIRVTFSSDCRLSSAQGLNDELAWCQAAYKLDGEPTVPTAYIVRVLGSQRYFSYFNFKYDSNDMFNLKSCHDLRTWTSLYVPRLFAEKDVSRWVFLERDVLNEFSEAIRDFQVAFVLMEYPFNSLPSR